jgi:hypothetical protein
MYEEGTPRPPTAADMARRELALEHIRIEHHLFCFPPAEPAERAELELLGSIDYGCTWDRHLEDMSILGVSELIALHQGYGIPYDATISSIGYEGELGLFWGHLAQCPDCDGWHSPADAEAHRAGDYHAAVVMGRNAPPPILSAEQLRALGRPVPEGSATEAAVLELDGLGPC